MQSSQLFAGSVWARYISVEAAWPSVHMGHPGLSASRMEAVRVLSESGWLFCVLLFFIPSPFSSNFVVTSLGSWPGVREEFRGGDHTAL